VPFVDVAVPLAAPKVYSYEIPLPLVSEVEVGVRVLIPFQRRHLVGLVVAVKNTTETAGCKPLIRVLDSRPVLAPHLIRLGEWLADYYLAPPGEVYRIMLPPGLLAKQVSPDQNPKAFWPTATLLGVVEVCPPVDPATLTRRQREILQTLSHMELPVLVRDLVEDGIASAQTLNRAAKMGLIRIEPVERHRSPWGERKIVEPTRHPLTSEQQACLDSLSEDLNKGSFQSALLHGVTGSGKTEVYLNLIERTLEMGRSALVLVPEIGLTPQISRQFRSWFQDKVAILHSALSEGERFDEWRRIRRGEARVTVGTRSAVFAPLQSLGLIVIDEEHDSSYKQNESPRYHARDTALKRAYLENALVVLGSATPQLETYHAAVHRGLHRYIAIGSRILERQLATVHIVDMRGEFAKHGKGAVFSTLLRQMIRGRLDRREQVLVLLNRRGYARFLLCRSCGHTETCESCSITLTYHQAANRLNCHYCGYSRSVPARCRECGKEYIFYVGEGTEKIQELLEAEFPEAAIDRLDRDSVQRRGSLERILDRFSARKTDLLIGTQMIAKGHDFPWVTLVGVLDAEAGLRLSDFRSAERTFQLLTQVSGRSGRGEQPGEVVIQTYYPNHYSLKYSCSQDYLPFSRQELDFRQKFRYPPYSALANILVQDRNANRAATSCRQFAGLLKGYRDELSSSSRMRILGPAPAALEKLKNEFRWQILVKTTNRQELHDVLAASLGRFREEKGLVRSLTIDIDPLNLM
jgi:primosomal protein N' (replication factor Y)